MNFKKKIGKVFTSKFVGTGPSSYKKRIYRAAVSQRLRNTALNNKRDGLWTMEYTELQNHSSLVTGVCLHLLQMLSIVGRIIQQRIYKK